MQFNKGTYALKDKVVNETILSSSNESLIGETVSFRPNFMGDKNSFNLKVDFGDMAIYNKVRGIPHITIATNAGGEPAMSNDFSDTDFEPIEPVMVCGKVEEILR